MNFSRNRLLLLLAFALTGCASQTFSPENAPEMVTISDFSAFYRLGPMQGRGPDASLTAGTRVKLLRKEMGYSLVSMEDGRTGYIANESLIPAPPRPKPEVAATGDAPGSSSGRRSRGARYRGPQVNDSPLPEPAPPPSLDLNIGPEDVVGNPPEPATTPQDVPKFRY